MTMGLLLAIASGIAAAAQAPASDPVADTIPYEENRLDMERMDALVARPIAQVEEGDVAGGVRTFEAMLAAARAARGADSVEVADLLMAFAAHLHALGMSSEESELLRMAVDYAGRSVPVYRAAFGAGHPEVAIALNSLADVHRRPNEKDPPQAAEDALAEAYRIRISALGATHKETLATRLYLAEVRGAPARLERDPALLDRVAADLEETARLAADSDPETAAEIPAAAQLRRALLFARGGRTTEARQAFLAAEVAIPATDEFDMCLRMSRAAEEIADVLAAAGQSDKAAGVLGLWHGRSTVECLSEELEELDPES
jgi:hypothetical protein